MSIGGQWTNRKKGRTPSLFMGGGWGLLDFCFLMNKNADCEKTRKGNVTTPLWAKCEDEIHTPKSGNLESSGTPENSELDCRGQTPRIGVFLISMERS